MVVWMASWGIPDYKALRRGHHATEIQHDFKDVLGKLCDMFLDIGGYLGESWGAGGV